MEEYNQPIPPGFGRLGIRMYKDSACGRVRGWLDNFGCKMHKGDPKGSLHKVVCQAWR
jgi:hypothetical protein